MKDNIKTGDLIITNFQNGYIITKIELTRGDYSYFATTFENSDYTGIAGYYYPKEHKSVSSLVQAIEEEEGISKVVPRESLQKIFVDLL